jgi:uncharacterized membrane protein
MYHALLFFHVLSAFLLAAAIVIYSAFALGSPVNRPTRLVGEILWGVGGLGTLALGIWLALYLDAYKITDGWVLTAIALWILATATGTQASRGVQPAGDDSALAIDSRAQLMHWARTLLFIALLVVMVWKPGA